MVDMPDDDDGFNDPPSNRGNDFFRYDEDNGWRDRDGVPNNPEAVYIIIKIGECAIGWFEERQRVITAKPLDLDKLNNEIPVEYWPIGKFSGKQEPPYKLGVFVLLVNPETGATYKFVHHTVGACMAFEELKEATSVMRRLRGENVYPVGFATSHGRNAGFRGNVHILRLLVGKLPEMAGKRFQLRRRRNCLPKHRHRQHRQLSRSTNRGRILFRPRKSSRRAPSVQWRCRLTPKRS